jgi:hypothetical protein
MKNCAVGFLVMIVLQCVNSGHRRRNGFSSFNKRAWLLVDITYDLAKFLSRGPGCQCAAVKGRVTQQEIIFTGAAATNTIRFQGTASSTHYKKTYMLVAQPALRPALLGLLALLGLQYVGHSHRQHNSCRRARTTAHHVHCDDPMLMRQQQQHPGCQPLYESCDSRPYSRQHRPCCKSTACG